MMYANKPGSPYCDWYKCSDGFRPIEFGTTASVAIHVEGEDYLIVANVGEYDLLPLFMYFQVTVL